MCMLTFDYPQTYAVTGSAEEQLAQLRSYIWQLVDVLNQADDANEAGIGAADTAAIRTELEKLRKALRDLEAKSGHGLPSGGTTGQTLTKLSGSDYDTGWRTPAGEGGGGASIIVDSTLSLTSTNPVENKVIAAALAGKASTAPATQSAAGLMSAADKTKLDALAAGGGGVTYMSADEMQAIWDAN